MLEWNPEGIVREKEYFSLDITRNFGTKIIYQLFKFPHLSNDNHNTVAIVTSYQHSNVTYKPITVKRIMFIKRKL